MGTIQIIELAVSVVVFALCLAGFLHTGNVLKTGTTAGGEAENAAFVKKYKKRKKLFFAGLLIGAWFALGVLITALSGLKNGLKIEFEMFSKRIDIFGISIAETTVIATGVVVVLAVLLVLFRLLAVPKFKEKPVGFQNIAEICIEAVDKFVVGVVGEQAARFLSPYMFAVALFLTGCAFVELLGLRAPTSDLTCTIALGLMTLILLNVFGIKKLGLGGRLKSMGGPVAPMRVIMVPLKVVSDIAVPISLGCRLFGNMLGGMIVIELLKGALGGYGAGIPAVAGLYFNLFHPLLQAYIFITLSLSFIDEAMEPVVEEPGKKKRKKREKETVLATSEN